MRRLLTLTLLLLSAISVSAQQKPPVPPFEIDSVQISPDGRYATFVISGSKEYWQQQWSTPREIYLLDLITGDVSPLALQPNGLIDCLTTPVDERRACSAIRYGYPSFLSDGVGVVWGAFWSETTDADFIPHSSLSWYDFEFGLIHDAQDVIFFGWTDVELRVPTLSPATGKRVFNMRDTPGEFDRAFHDIVRLYDLEENFYVSFETSADNSSASSPDWWLWAINDGQPLLVGGSRDGTWHVFNLDQEIVTGTAFAPIANVEGEQLTLIQFPDDRGYLRWRIASADPTLSPEEAILRARQLMNADAAEFVRAALEAALVAEFSQTGFSLHPGMTAIFDEFQIYDVLGVEREDTLLVPLEWRLAQPPEGESRPLDVTDPIPFPGVG